MLNSLKSHSDITLTFPVRTAVISVPEYVSEQMLHSIYHAAQHAGFALDIDGSEQGPLRITDAARVAYGLGAWRGGGVVAGHEDGRVGERSGWLVVDYNDAFMGIRGTGSDATLNVGEGVFPDLGEGQGDWEMVRGKLADRLSVYLRDGESGAEEAGKGDTSLKRKDVKAVIFAGDASSGAFAALKMALQGLLPHLGRDGEGWLLSGIEPLYVGAVGAARRGRDMVDQQKRYKVKVGSTPVEDHGEL